MRRFDPRAVGRYECRAWETYYRRKWAAFLIASVALVRAAFRMSWPKTLYGAWLVLRANMQWAPFPDNDPDGARATMARFYRLLGAADLDPVRAAELEVEWWRAHRENQYGDHALGEALIVALRDLYAYTYGERRRTSAARPSCERRRWTSPTAGSRRARTRSTRCCARSARCSCAPTRHCSAAVYR